MVFRGGGMDIFWNHTMVMLGNQTNFLAHACLTQDGSLFTVISTLQSCACFKPLFSKESSQIFL